MDRSLNPHASRSQSLNRSLNPYANRGVKTRAGAMALGSREGGRGESPHARLGCMGKPHAHIAEKDRVHQSFGKVSLSGDAARLQSAEPRGGSVPNGDTWESALPPWEGPAILLMDLDAFFASVEQFDHPEWKGKPVIVGGDPKRHGIVSTCSYEARTFGVHSAMPSSQAARLCPNAIWTHGNFARYREVSKQVMNILYDESPLLMQVSIDEAFLDISPTRVNRTHPVVVAKRIQEAVDKLGITCSIGLGTSKAVAKVASNMEKPHGITVVWPGDEAAFLRPLPVGEMSGIGPVAQKRLKQFGIRTLGQLASADKDALKAAFGKNAELMRERALGIDSPVSSTHEPAKSISNEITVSNSVSTRTDVEALIATMAHKVGRRLRRKEVEGTTLHLKVRYENLKVRTCQKRIPNLGTNEITWLPILSRMLDELWSEGTKLRLVGVSVSGFDGEAPAQATLFEQVESTELELDAGFGQCAGPGRNTGFEQSARSRQSAKKAEALLAANDAIAKRFGEDAVRFGHEIRSYGSTTGSSAKNPEDYKN